jgi:hypothetical protein
MIWSAVATKVIGILLFAYRFGLITPIGWFEIALIWGIRSSGPFPSPLFTGISACAHSATRPF